MSEAKPKKLVDMTVADLLERQWQIKTSRQTLKIYEENLNDELQRRFGAAAKEAYAAKARKDGTESAHGTVRVSAGADGVVVKVDTKEAVSWDQDKLKAVAYTMPWEQAAHYFTIKFDVKESIYKALPPGNNIKPLLTEARTTKMGEPKFELVAAE